MKVWSHLEVGHPPLFVTFSFHSLIMHHISGTIQYLIIIFGTRVKRYVEVYFFYFLKIFDFLGC